LSAEFIAMDNDNSARFVRQVQIAMLVSIAAFVGAGEFLTRGAGEFLARAFTRAPDNTLFHALSFISISLVGATVVVRRTLILPSEHALKERPDDSLAIARWRAGYLFLYAMCEALGVFGLILRAAGFTLGNVWGFYLGGFLLLLLYSPPPSRANSR
jgi:hypothetical protein